MRAVRQKVDTPALEEVRRLDVVAVTETLAVDFEQLLRVAGPLDAFFGPRIGDFTDFEEVGGDLGLVDDVLLAVGVFEPGRVDDAVGSAVALVEVAYGVEDTVDGVADGTADAVLIRLLLVLGCEVP